MMEKWVKSKSPSRKKLVRHQKPKPQSPNRKRVPKLPLKGAEEKVLTLYKLAYSWKSFLQNIFVAEREAAQKDGADGAGDGDSSEEASETTELVPAERDEEVSSDEEGDEEQYWKKVQKKGKMTTFKAFSKEKYFSAIK